MTITGKLLMALSVFMVMLCFAMVIVGSHLEEEEDVASVDADAATAIKKIDGEIDAVVEESTKASIKAVSIKAVSAVEENICIEFCINKEFGTLLILIVIFLGIIIIALYSLNSSD